MGGEEDKLFYYPLTNVTENIIEEVRVSLEIVASSEYTLIRVTINILCIQTTGPLFVHTHTYLYPL